MMPTLASLARLFFSFRGRIARTGFWLVSLTWFVLAEAFDYWWSERGVMAAARHNHTMVNAALILGSLPVLVSCVGISVKRLHDRNKSAWWLVAFGLAPPLLQIAASLDTLDGAPAVALLVASLALSLWALVELGFMPGTTGPNRFGRDPQMALDAEPG
jgi:uncharacterized membrane protein YhaH (DUF805 family)